MWQRWISLPGVVDVVGPRPDGSLVAAASGRLHLVRPDGTTTPFGSYSTDPGPESYIAMAPGLDVTGAGCRFAEGEVFALELGTPPQAVVRVTLDGQASRFVETPPTDLLTGIAFDATGRFGNQLLVTGRRGDRTVLFSIDCRGRLRTVTDNAPLVEGGMAVAPGIFADHAGDLIAPDENTGNIVFIRFDGTSGVLIKPDLPTGQDVGVESVGFIPRDFVRRRGTVYVADRRAPGAPTEGTDGIWRLTADVLGPFGIDENDLVVVTEAGRSAVVRCRTTCRVLPLGNAGGAHIEGHVTAALGEEPPAPPRAGGRGTALFAITTGVIVAGGFILFFVHNRKIREPDRP
ncbi:MAG: hypothetical protein M3326_00195 [Actinomycetota bacterium]|nr:hypothetical protein [Actinomycetota bacterium]